MCLFTYFINHILNIIFMFVKYKNIKPLESILLHLIWSTEQNELEK